MTRANSDCTGKRFGRLIVLGKGSKLPRKNSYRQLYELQCDCGKIIEIPRSSFEAKGQISCGCARKLGLVDNKRRCLDISGQKFGEMTAIALTRNKIKGKPGWLLRCDCGGMREMSLTLIRHYQRENIRLNCRNKDNHTDRWLRYPATPNPYPKEAGLLLEKYLHLTELDYEKIDSEIEDEKRDRLLRAAWIITYRRQQGEQISELYEKRFINKHLWYCSIDVFWKRKLATHGGLLYNASGEIKKTIGDTMTNVTIESYPVIETQGINILSNNLLPSKKLKFRRC